MEYSKQVHENKNNELFEYSILKAKDDKSIWDEIFKKYYQLFRYYQYLSMEINYSQNQMTTTYSPISFQDFIDERITFQSVGYREYQRFIKSMQDTTFKNNLIKKYQTEVNSRSLKNHIIYIVF
jgi:predicted N-acyltransferase